jgi:hypothetical protein
MGLRGAGNGTVGRLAVMSEPSRLIPAGRAKTTVRAVMCRAMGVPLVVMILLAGCTSSAQITAVVTGGVAGAATGSPAVGFLVAVATDAGANYVVRYVGRTRQGAEQDAIAQVAGDLPIGTEADWKIEHTIPIGNEHGRLQVVRVIDSPLASCKEIAFSVDEGKAEKLHRAWFTTDVCKDAQTWKWSSAEPAVERWGFLQ